MRALLIVACFVCAARERDDWCGYHPPYHSSACRVVTGVARLAGPGANYIDVYPARGSVVRLTSYSAVVFRRDNPGRRLDRYEEIHGALCGAQVRVCLGNEDRPDYVGIGAP